MPPHAAGQQRHAERAEYHPDQVPPVPGAAHRHHQRSEELDGHRHAERDPGERLIDGEVHHAQRQAERDRDRAIAPRPPPDDGSGGPRRAAPGDEAEHQRREPQPEQRHRRGRHGAEHLVRYTGPELDTYHTGEDEQRGKCCGPAHSHLKTRAATTMAATAQTSNVTVLPTGNATWCARTSRRPVDSAPVGSSSKTCRAPAGNLVSGNTTPPRPSSTIQTRLAAASVASARSDPAMASASPLNAAVPSRSSSGTTTIADAAACGRHPMASPTSRISTPCTSSTATTVSVLAVV